MRIHALIFACLSLWVTVGQAAGLTPVPGQPAALSVSLPALDGAVHDLAQLRGKVVLLNFWATWCPPCRQEMPSMARLQGKLTGMPFRILAVDVAEDRADVEAFLKETRVNFPVLIDGDAATAKRWRVRVMPTSYLIDKQGRLRYVLTGGAEWDEGDALAKVQGLLAE
jgi:thiol-disulfide isomerase/thioredoxin